MIGNKSNFLKMQFLFYYFVCVLAIFLFIKIFTWKELVGYLVSLHKLSLSKTPRLLVYIISLKKHSSKLHCCCVIKELKYLNSPLNLKCIAPST